MKTLLILRHAKSSWKHEGMDDHDRPLNDRGEHDAPRMGRLLRQAGCVPAVIVSSSAVRARRTAETVAATCGYEGRVHVEPALYLAEPATYLEVAAGLGADVDALLVVGHNPGIADLVRLLTGRNETMPTAALARVGLPIDDWAELHPGIRGELLDLWRPKELT